MARREKPKFDEKSLTKGQLRKLNALRKSLGPEIADRAFSEWLARQPAEAALGEDRHAATITGALSALVLEKKLRIRRGGYLVKRGRGRVIVTPAEA